MIIRLLFTVLFLAITHQLAAQIGYGRPYYVLEQQWEAEREEAQIKTTHNYTFKDSLQAKESAENYYIRHYNKKGKLVVYIWFKKSASDGEMHLQMIDSISYTDDGIFKEKRKFFFKKDNFQQTYRATASHNNKGQIDTLFMYGRNDVLESIRVYKYTSSDKIDSTFTYRAKSKKLSTTHAFKYDKKGNLVVRHIKTRTGFSFTLLNYTNDNLLDNYIETYSNAKETGRTMYTYDSSNRLIKWNYSTNNYYYNNCYWFYEGDAKAPYIHYTESPKSKDDESLNYHYERYTYEYFE